MGRILALMPAMKTTISSTLVTGESAMAGVLDRRFGADAADEEELLITFKADDEAEGEEEWEEEEWDDDEDWDEDEEWDDEEWDEDEDWDEDEEWDDLDLDEEE
jgi:hypothetical protein